MISPDFLLLTTIVYVYNENINAKERGKKQRKKNKKEKKSRKYKRKSFLTNSSIIKIVGKKRMIQKKRRVEIKKKN